VNAVIEPLKGTKSDGQIVIDILNKMGGHEPAEYDAAYYLAEIARIVPFFKGATWDGLTDQGKQWPIAEGNVGTERLHLDTFKRGKGKFHFFNFKESNEIVQHGAEFPFILTTGRILEHYNCGTMTRRTGNADIVDRDLLAIHPDDAKKKGIKSGDIVRVFSVRGGVEIEAKVSEEVKPGILYTTFHFPEHLVNIVTSSECDEDTMCPEYKVVAVDCEKVSAAPKKTKERPQVTMETVGV
jgi:formate dehydrogenase major subunit